MGLSEENRPGILLDLLGYRERALPLDGVRVLDLTRVWAGPFAARHLADLGAEVLRLEFPDSRGPAKRPAGTGLRFGIFPGGQPDPDPWNRQGAVNKLNRNKLSLSIDFEKPHGLDILQRLVSISDVLIENYSSRVMPNWGLDWPHLKEINPKLVYLSSTGFGRTGPYRDYVAAGAITEPHGGLSALMSYDGNWPYRTQATYSDPLVGLVAAWAIVAALLRREQTGEGVAIDLPHTEATARVMGDHILAVQGGVWKPAVGNRNPVFIPQGVYQCSGDDNWIAISVENERAWEGLCKLLCRDVWLADAELATTNGRAKRQPELNEAITAWTKNRDKIEAMNVLQAAGVAAGAVITNQEMVESDVLSPAFLVPITENWGETIRYPAFPVRIQGSERRMWHRSPRLGEHNHLILSKLLGFTDEKIRRLEDSGTICERPRF